MSAATRGGEVLSPRALNRALLERQHLLSRTPLGIRDAVERLVGLQAQAPLAPYLGLWLRLEGFTTDALAEAMRSRAVLRTHLWRSTIHLLTGRDALALRPLMQPQLERSVRNTLVRHVSDARLGVLVPATRALLHSGTFTRPQLAAALQREHPADESAAVAAAVGSLVPTVQVTPRGVWGESGAAAWTTLERWTGGPLMTQAPDAAEVLVRYLAAFGPSSAADMRKWSGLSGLRPAIERLRPRLRTFRDERGVELFDLPDAPLPDPETPAPPRFLPEYDNVLFGHEDRARINDRRYPLPLLPGNGAAAGTLLLDGFYRGMWRLRREPARAAIAIELFAPLTRAQSDELAAEAIRLLGFLAPEAADRDVAIRPSE